MSLPTKVQFIQRRIQSSGLYSTPHQNTLIRFPVTYLCVTVGGATWIFRRTKRHLYKAQMPTIITGAGRLSGETKEGLFFLKISNLTVGFLTFCF